MPKQIDRGPSGEEDPVRVTEGLGGVTGAAAGAGLGAILGPAGIVVGGLAGAVGGWWAGKEVAEAAGDFDEETDAYYRSLHEKHHAGVCEYEAARSYYHLGALARRNPHYSGRSFDEVDRELRRGWSSEGPDRFRTWDEVRPFVRRGYEDTPQR